MEQNSFITNQDKLLSDIINGILPKSRAVDILVGYFYYSGYRLISEKLQDKRIRILVGLDIDATITRNIREIDSLVNANKSRAQIKEEYFGNFVRLFNETDFFDNNNKLEGFTLFYNKLKDGTLEIRKTEDPCHAKLYIFDYSDEVNENDGLSGYELRFINKLKPAEYTRLPEQIDNYYIARIIDTYNHVDDGEETLILAEELQ